MNTFTYIIKFTWDYSAGNRRQLGEEIRVFDHVEEAQKVFEELDSKFDRTTHRPRAVERFIIELSLQKVPLWGTAGEPKMLNYKSYDGGKS